MDNNSLSHTRWNCKYHIVFSPKYRRREIYGKLRNDIGKIIRGLCKRKGINIIEAECCVDHIHMLVEIPPKYSVAEVMGYIKGKSSLMIFDRHANLKYKYGNRHFWCRGYYVDSRKECKENRRICKKSTARRYSRRTIKFERIYRPIYGEEK